MYQAMTIDVENDGVALANERTSLRWTGIQSIPSVKRALEELAVKVTWFVRADEQLRDVYGTSAYLLEEHGSLWRQLTATGDCLAWHPHLYRRDATTMAYAPDIDAERCALQLRSVHAELHDRGHAFSAVRIGEAFHANALMRALDELGLLVDSTAVPGRRRHDGERVMDWAVTPNEPYRPSRHDYRLPDPSASLGILEVPMTTLPIKAPYDPKPLTRYINPSYRHGALKDGFDTHLETLVRLQTNPTFCTIILHPDELSAVPGDHPLYSSSLDEVRRNVLYMQESATKRGFDVVSITMEEIARLGQPPSASM